MNDKIVLFEDKIIKKAVYSMWEKVMSGTNTLIFQAKAYGFSKIEVIPDPNIHQMIAALRGIESVLDVIIDQGLFDKMEYDDIRRALNAREAIRKMEYVAIALKANDQDAYDQAIDELTKQVDF